MTSHDYARQLQDTAAYLFNCKEVEIGESQRISLDFWGQKDIFLHMVRATVPGRKVVGDYSVCFEPKNAPLTFRINRDLVCRKVQDVKYECEPLLSKEEDAEMESA